MASPRTAAGRAASSARAFVIDLAVPPQRPVELSPFGSDPEALPDDAARKDHDAIRRLLRENVFGGEVGLSLEREPDSFVAAAIEGDVHQTLVARDRASGRVVAMAGRSVRDAYVNGRPARLGYFGQLRIDPAFRQRRILDAGFGMCRRLHERGDAHLYLLSVVADNTPAVRMLERRRPGWPVIDPIDRFVTLAMPVGPNASACMRGSVQTRSGTAVGCDAIIDCLSRNNRRYQFAPCWAREDLESSVRTPGLALDDFLVAIRGGAVVGCVACWDQRAFKQVIVRRYSRRLRVCRPLINLIAPLTGMVPLPRAGTRLEFAYLSHLATDDEDPEVFEQLVRAGCELGRTKGVDCVALGLPARGPQLAYARRSFGHRAYESILYVAVWPDAGPLICELDGRPSNPELAIL